MLKGIEIPIRTTVRDRKPTVSAADKLEHIQQKQAIRPVPDLETGLVSFKLPYVDDFKVEFNDEGTIMSINHFNIGDRALIGHGIGSRLLKRAIDHGLECYPNLNRLIHASANLALVNTVVKVVGEEYVSVNNRGQRYGFGTDRPLEAMFEDHPYTEDYPYLVDRVEAVLDRDAMLKSS